MYLDKTEYHTSLDLSLYIEGLLCTDPCQVEQKNRIEDKIETILLNDLVAPDIEDNATKVETKTETQQIETKTVVEQGLAEKLEEMPDSNIPAWGKQPFKCLSVNLAGMKLMIPAMSVSYVERINKNIIRLPLEAEAFRGVVTLRERSVSVIDLHKLISKNGISYNHMEKNVEECHVEYVIVMDDGAYALSCDHIGEMIELYPEDIRWNKASFNNPLFAGIVPDKLCAIVNIDTVNEQIATMPFVQSLNSNYLNS